MLIKIYEEKPIYKGDYIDEYVAERGVDNISGCSGQNIYEDYLEFCKEHGYDVEINNAQFRKRLTLRFGFTSKVVAHNGKSVRVLFK